MKLPHFSSRKKSEELSKQDDQIFAEAAELATLRLEQCIADQRMILAFRETLRSRGHQPRKSVNLL